MTPMRECASRMLLAFVVFILLSVPIAVAAEENKCYWCGPLAEQVHKSQRAPSCNQYEQHETVCDKGYTHCAFVATSPPYAESRLCVKFYQDECYSLYCNSTKTWRMICPCRGDLCNGAHTDREINAFATLAKIVAKVNYRNKRALVSSSFINIRTRSSPNNITAKNITDSVNSIELMQGDQPQPIEINIKNTSMPNNVSKKYKDETSIEHGSTVTAKNDEADTMSIVTTISTTVEEKIEIKEPTTPMDLKVENTEIQTTSMKPTSIQMELAVTHNTNEKDPMPPAEALQHNETPIAVELTTMGTVEVTTNENKIMESTASNNNTKKNLAAQNVIQLSTLVLSVVLHL